MNNFHFRKIKQLKDWERDLSAVLVFKNDMDEETRNDTIRYRSLLAYAIDQIERVQELERANKQLERQAPGIELELLNMELTDALKQNKCYREALEFYAEQDNYAWETSYRPQQEIDCMVIDDGGHTARKALEGK